MTQPGKAHEASRFSFLFLRISVALLLSIVIGIADSFTKVYSCHLFCPCFRLVLGGAVPWYQGPGSSDSHSTGVWQALLALSNIDIICPTTPSSLLVLVENKGTYVIPISSLYNVLPHSLLSLVSIVLGPRNLAQAQGIISQRVHVPIWGIRGP